MAKAPKPVSAKELEELNADLAEKSFVAGTANATTKDLEMFKRVATMPERSKLPHLARWYLTMSLKCRQAAGHYQWPEPVSKKSQQQKKDTKGMVIDCVCLPMPDVEVRRTPQANPPGLGASASCLAGSRKRDKYYISTAINYANGFPHMGHAYEALTADVFARFRRVNGQDTFYMTGSDEHGAKIAQVAEADGITPQASVDKYVQGFKGLNQRLLISNDYYVRTTDQSHKDVARQIWEKCKAKGDIYLDRYEGWYLIREERFITDQEAQEWDYKDPSSGVPLKKMSEPSYFFKLAKWKDAVLKHIEDNEGFIQPKQYRTEILERLREIEMRDLSISRATFSWGVDCPEPLQDGSKHVMYVWFDALTNYLSGVHGLDKKHELSRFWPCDCHIIGKDIIWFHTVMWPAFLMSAGVPLPKCVIVHGFIQGPDGRKMSKSWGNVVDPHEELDSVCADTFRWYLCREAAYGDDVKYSPTSMRLMHNADLNDKLGNLVNRAITLCKGAVPEADISLAELPFDLKAVRKAVTEAYDNYKLSEAATITLQACKDTNKWVADLEPWKMKADELQAKKQAVLRLLLEAVYILAHFFAPFTPTASDAIFKKLGTEPIAIPDLKADFKNLKTGRFALAVGEQGKITDGDHTDKYGKVVKKTGGIYQLKLEESDAIVELPESSVEKVNSILFAPLEVDASALASAPKAEAKPDTKEPKPDVKAKPDAKAKAQPKEATEKKDANKGAAPAEDEADQPLFSKLDVRVGEVVDAWHHPDADKLFVEKIDVGEDQPRQIVSGLREHYTLEQFKGRKLLAVCNMKPSKLMKVESSGMVLCAKKGDKVELLDVPADCKVGDRVLPEGCANTWQPVGSSAVAKKKIWDSVAKELKTDDKMVACMEGKPLVFPNGKKVQAPSLPDSQIS